MSNKKAAKVAKVSTPRGEAAAIIPLDARPYNVRYTLGTSQGIVRGTGADWFGPLNPMAPTAPREVAGRQFDYIQGYNLVQTPRAYEPIGFPELKALAQVYDVLRLVIETRKDEMERLKFSLRPREKKLQQRNAAVPPAVQTRIDGLQQFFKRPDGVTPWGTWLRMLLEDLYVIDAPTLYCQRSRAGKLVALLPMDGGTIKRVIDDWGRTPQPYTGLDGAEVVPPAYQQVLKGLPAVDYSVRDLIYRPRNPRPGRVYGFSPVEQILMTVNIALRRQVWQLSYYTEGNIPEALIGVPESWTPSQIRDYQNYWDSYFTGDLAARRRAKFVPGAMSKNVQQTKDPELINKFDEWLARVVCFAMGVSPQPFVAMMNRATAGTAQDTAEETGLQPSKQWVKGLIDDVLELEFASPDLELAWEEEDEIDQVKQQEVLSGYAKTGALTLNEIRERLGEQPYADPNADLPMVLTPTGYVPIDANTIEGKKAMMEAMPAPAPGPGFGGQPGGGGSGGGGGSRPPPKPAEKGHRPHAVMTAAFAKAARARRQRRTAPIPFDRPVTRKARVAVRAVFFKLFRSMAPKVAGQVRAALKKLGKAERTPAEIAAEIAAGLDLDQFDLVFNKVADELEAVAGDAATTAIAQLGVEDRAGLFNQVNDRAVADARERAAELLGKSWVDGELVDNPNAEWAVTDSTRDLVRQIIADGLNDNIGGDEIADLIEGSAAFTQDRADLIARTEIANANSDAALDGYRAARDDAGVAVKKEWLLGPEPCPICEENADAGPIDLDDEFPSGDDAPTAHPNCECALMPVVEDGDGTDESEVES